jgi:Concanavalin A-like lectin/glucanases superfamily
MTVAFRTCSWWRSTFATLLLVTLAVPTAQASYMSDVLADGPEAYWQFEDGNSGDILDGAAAADATGNHPGTYMQAGSDGPQLVAGAPGVGGIAAHFVGTSATVGDYIKFDTLGNVGSNIDNNGMTFEFLLKNAGNSTVSNRIFGVSNDRPVSGAAGRRLTMSFGFEDLQASLGGPGDSIILRDDSDQAWAYRTDLGGVDMEDGKWHHVAWVVDPGVPAGGTHVYVDGVEITLSSATGVFGPKPVSNFSNFDKPFVLGAENIFTNPPGTAPIGLIRTFASDSILDEFAVYSKALTAEQVRLHAQAAGQFVPEPSALLLLGMAIGAGLLHSRRK